MAFQNFKVIVIGGGPVGLTSAHALHKAGIDFIILERSSTIAVEVGASLSLAPTSLRVLHQLGLFDQLKALGAETDFRKCFTLDGHEFKSHPAFDDYKRNHGCRPYTFHRAELVQFLYDQLPDGVKPNVLTGKKVTDIQSAENEVKVFCDDGSVYEGDLVLGADGVHSKARQIMRKLALEADPNATWDSEMPYTSVYRCMWASFKIPTAPGVMCETQHKDRSTMYLTSKDRGFFFLYEKLPEPTKARTFYTDEDIQAMAGRFADYPITDIHKVKHLFPERLTCGMSNLQEGICNNWGWGRIVLAGDSMHKECPNAGQGYQNGIQDVVSLVNNLRQSIASSGASNSPSVSALEAMYKSYQSQRWGPLLRNASFSAHITRIQSWANMWYYLVGRILLAPRFVDHIIANWVQAPAWKKSLAFNFLDAEEPFDAQVAWVHPLKNIY